MKRKKITSRQKKIILMIVENSKKNIPITISEIAGELELSSRTVLRDMSGIEKWFDENDFNFVKKPGVGLILEENVENQNFIIELLEEEKIEKEYSKEERNLIILSKLLVSNEPVKSYYFTKILKVSEGVLNNDFASASKWLKRFDIELVRKPGLGVYLKGQEKSFREAYVNLIYDSFNEKEILDMVRNISENIQTDKAIEILSENRLLNLMDRCIIRKVESTLTKKLSDLDVNLADSAYIGLVVHISLALQRIKNGENITMDKEFLKELSMTEEFKLAQEIVKGMEIDFSMDIPLDEVGYITMHIRGAKQRLSSNHKALNLDDIEVMDITNKMIDLAEDEFKISLKNDKRLFKDLANHLGPSINRLNMGLEIRNPLLEEIKSKYSYAYNGVEKISRIIKEKLNINSIPESEIGYIAMHFASAIEKNLMMYTNINIVVACPTGIGTSRFLSTKIENKFPNLNILETISAINIDEEYLREKEVDLIVSTVELNTNLDYICVGPFMSLDDEQIIKEKIKSIAQNKLINLNVKNDTKNKNKVYEQITESMNIGKDILQFLEEIRFEKFESKDLSELIVDSSKIFVKSSEDIISIEESLKERLKISIPYIEESKILLLHCMNERIDIMKLAIIKLENGIMLDSNEEIDNVVFMLLPKNSPSYQRQIMSEISGSLIDNIIFTNKINKFSIEEMRLEIKDIVFNFYTNRLKVFIDK
ncbi:BglG family transcription antiterminator [Clostridioides sp. ES-S-0108-01]|nr:BglG family transcription antiterminator [Clostridioides sp. ES-S-0108-01]UDN50028.1 BglG family transcription antiterminator [Clostridioides sp. ES-S-0107-01]